VLESLTNGERRVAELVARGWTNDEVASALNLRTKTVEWTLTNVYRKLRLRSRTELALHVAGADRSVQSGGVPGRHVSP
jgi:DNA-binding NarL/FixJ family response regulator